MSRLIVNPNRMVVPTTGERAVLEQLYSDSDINLNANGNKAEARRTSSRMCFGVEHGDYNGTRLFGVAIGVEPEKPEEANGSIWFAYRPTNDGKVLIKSLNAPKNIADFRIGEIPPASEVSGNAAFPWIKFPMGASYIIQKNGYPCERGIEGVLVGRIPRGGLSSSASLSLNVMLSMLEANGVDASKIDPFQVINMARAVENEYVGSPCGDLDQAMIYLGQAGKATIYSSRDKLIDHVDLSPKAFDFRLVVMDTGTKRAGLKGTTYEKRQAECKRIVGMFGEKFGFEMLADISPDTYRAVHQAINDSDELGETEKTDLSGRLKYIHEANMRFDLMVDSWKRGNVFTMGKIMDADGRGLRSDYKISGPQLETMVDLARGHREFLGGRMSGGGDYGAAQGIRLNEPIGPFRKTVLAGYEKSWPEYSEHAAVHNCQLVDGVVKLYVK
jgi:galactokinase